MKMGKSTREAFGLALAKLGEESSDVVVVDGDVHNLQSLTQVVDLSCQQNRAGTCTEHSHPVAYASL